ncbi:MAG: hypothetical protein H8K06_17405 [Nitrospira sp.]|uniref:hypothetical protein n=1 Tax=Nitrospira defluvii TaxID=330214 RepID=UPI001BB47F81|nr:hypothetical protein [Nitrospira defluvii]MCS6328844.1 hypothetical protein [Nitrospira sp.]
MTTQSRVVISKETDHGRYEKIHLAEDRKGRLLRNLRLRVLFLRVPGQCLSLRADQLPMWLPQANRGTVSRFCPGPPDSGGPGLGSSQAQPRAGIVRTSPLAYHA